MQHSLYVTDGPIFAIGWIGEENWYTTCTCTCCIPVHLHNFKDKTRRYLPKNYQFFIIWCPTMKEIGEMITFQNFCNSAFWHQWNVTAPGSIAGFRESSYRSPGPWLREATSACKGDMGNWRMGSFYRDEEGKVLWRRIQQVSIHVHVCRVNKFTRTV